MYYNKLECGKYYEVITRNKDYRHLNLVEFDYIDADYFLHFIDDEGNNIFLDYCDILDICESKEKKRNIRKLYISKIRCFMLRLRNIVLSKGYRKTFIKFIIIVL